MASNHSGDDDEQQRFGSDVDQRRGERSPAQRARQRTERDRRGLIPADDDERCRVVRDYDLRQCPHPQSATTDEPICALHASTVTYTTVDEIDPMLLRPDLRDMPDATPDGDDD